MAFNNFFIVKISKAHYQKDYFYISAEKTSFLSNILCQTNLKNKSSDLFCFETLCVYVCAT